ncbi:3-hydroxyacyl-CoA dehydrogenase family protein [Fusobacterium nucleatum]|uniref:3-hydroxyacyl-CoA dehydrogenase family protein n=1 Tax=Fusobacterium nucleatum TaxID=851 RepID=UPI00201A3EB8|nr:3-hydroxyacyl-CoA dehydrogenase family protein [Fusobacterium nucleatum]MCL4584730.1 3-hydroxyacyl-CoA dehydrogenase [Fusobacterium nucleatum YWH7055]
MIKIIAVLGAGTMGHGIAEVFAMNNFQVNLYEISNERRNSVKEVIKKELEFLEENKYIDKDKIKNTLNNIFLYSDLKAAVENADFVIEVTPEKLELKQELFKNLSELTKKGTILASNTSSLSLMEMIKFVPEEKKKYCMVNHWYNPAHLMPLVELSYFGNMPEKIFIEIEKIYKKANKITIRVLKDIPGLIANRIQQGVAREVFSLMEMEVASYKDIDKALMFGPAFRYATTGQLEIADMGGIDIWYTVGNNLLKVMDNSQCANKLLKEKVEMNKLGIKTGEGFFKYNKDDIERINNNFYKKLLLQLKVSKNYQL